MLILKRFGLLSQGQRAKGYKSEKTEIFLQNKKNAPFPMRFSLCIADLCKAKPLDYCNTSISLRRAIGEIISD